MDNHPRLHPLSLFATKPQDTQQEYWHCVQYFLAAAVRFESRLSTLSGKSVFCVVEFSLRLRILFRQATVLLTSIVLVISVSGGSCQTVFERSGTDLCPGSEAR
jgi:hypothetical protein